MQDDEPGARTQALALKFLKEAVKGAFDQSVFTRPPMVAQSSAFHRLAYILIGWLLGKGTPIDSKLLNTLMGMLSTKNLLIQRKGRNRVDVSNRKMNSRRLGTKRGFRRIQKE